MIENASRMELIQLIAACVGLAFGVWGLTAAVRDTQLTGSADVDPRRLIALANVRRQVMRIIVHALLVFGGISSVILPPPPTISESTQSIILHVVLVIVTIFLTVDYAMDHRVRLSFMHHSAFQRNES